MSETERINPDDPLAQMQNGGAVVKKTGKLKVFFGAAPGVGKTYAMLEEARKSASEGVDVVIGYAEPHIRQETEALLLGMELLKYKLVEYRGATLKEFDLESALQRKPKLLCVDELAHTNPPGLRHQKRWQDVFELLDAGIDVYTTLNVQHLESVNDIVERITGVEVRETLPDEALDRADEIELIDTTPEELTERLREGKIYRPDVAERAIRQFFNKGNLTALRELALRRTAERVDAQMQEHRQKARVRQTWAASERLLVCIGPSPLSARLVRSTRRLAASLRAPWVAVTVETPATSNSSQISRDRAIASLRLAQQLGGEAVTLSGEDVADTLTDYARQRNVTKIVIGKPDLPRWKERLFGSLVDDVIRRSGDVDVYVIRGEATPPPKTGSSARPLGNDWTGYVAALLATGFATSVGWLLHRVANVSDANVLMVYLLGVLAVSWWFSRRASALTAFLGVLAFDFTFVRPYFSFSVSDREYIFTLAVMLLTSVLIGTLVHRTRSQTMLFRRRQVVTQSLLEFATELARQSGTDAIAQAAAVRVGAVFECPAAVMLPASDKPLRIAGSHGSPFADTEKESAVAKWVMDHNEVAGAGTATLPMAAGSYLPLRGSGSRVIGVLAIQRSEQNPLVDTENLRLLESLALQAATAIERAELTDHSREAWKRVEQENLRNTLLSSVSHDLRTPLTAITGSASALAEPSLHLPETARRELASTIVSESRRMERVISNLLDITRLEAGMVPLNLQPTHLGELIHGVTTRLASRLEDRPITIHIPDLLPEVTCDPIAIDQVITNLFENALQHTPSGSPIDVDVSQDRRTIRVEIADRGPGFAAGAESRIFEKFVRLSSATDRRGIGLGLAISKAIIEAHNGSIHASNREGGGASFRFTLPCVEILTSA